MSKFFVNKLTAQPWNFWKEEASEKKQPLKQVGFYVFIEYLMAYEI